MMKKTQPSRMKEVGICLLILAFVFISVVSCSTLNRQGRGADIVGRWQWEKGCGDDSFYMVFDSKGFVRAQFWNEEYEGIFHVTPDGDVICKWKDGLVDKFVIQGERLVLGGSYPAVFRKTKFK